MKEAYLVYPDRFKQVFTLMMSSLFIVGCGGLLIGVDTHIVAKLFLGLMILLFGLHVFQLLQTLIKKQLLYRIDDKGITDYTKKGDVLFLTWDEIMKIEIISNNTSLQIGIVASKTLNDKELMSKSIKKNMLVNGNCIFYNVMIDGYAFRKKYFNEIFSEIASFARNYNNKIIINEYHDPLTKMKTSQ